ncbi:nuclear transport factor 2 family protein [Streptomyces sp. H27-H1]|uniref:nuclear transport factor 2 family protein n=1 Tax=Streptomyces sp. H27-H1 TaxID=2996461 RepID=UPI002271C921|nr:nuclear transport factor 2 family protein [Streptomyces sp. H27-H1]MCY0927980.1 nuclear transport factor 2 family protein [Streptomyces sp. H27-H1]
MSDQRQLWDNYAACWSADPEIRLAALGAVVVDDVSYRDPQTEVSSLAELDAYMNGFAAAFPGHRFRIEDVFDHHGRSLARWTQLGPDGGAFMTGVSSAVHRDGLLADVTGFFLSA